MPTIPASVPSRAVHINIVGGSAHVVTLESPALFDASGALVLPASRWRATLDADGEATLTVPRTDVDTISPTDWSYTVTTTLATLPPVMYLQVVDGVGDLEFASAVNVGSPPSPASTYVTAAAFAAHEAATTAAIAAAAAAAAAQLVAHVAAEDPHGDRAYTDQTIAVLDAAVQTLGTRVLAIEQGTAFLAGLQVVGDATISGGTLTAADAVMGGINFLLPLRFGGLLTYAGPPGDGTWETGTVVIGSTGILHLCTAAGTPGTWTSAP